MRSSLDVVRAHVGEVVEVAGEANLSAPATQACTAENVCHRKKVLERWIVVRDMPHLALVKEPSSCSWHDEVLAMAALHCNQRRVLEMEFSPKRELAKQLLRRNWQEARGTVLASCSFRAQRAREIELLRKTELAMQPLRHSWQTARATVLENCSFHAQKVLETQPLHYSWNSELVPATGPSGCS